MSSKVLNTSVSLDDLSASELNAAIDDTNFPGTKCPTTIAALAAAAGESGTSPASPVVAINGALSALPSTVAAGKSVKPSNGVGHSIKEVDETNVKDNTNHTNNKLRTSTTPG